MSQLLTPPLFTAYDSTGAPLSGGKLYTYAPGTTTAKATYYDAALTNANTNPIILNSRGEVTDNKAIYFSGTIKIKLTDSADVTVWTLDNLEGQGSTIVSGYNLSDYPTTGNGRLDNAITAIGATEGTLWIDVDDTVADDVGVPTTLALQPLHGNILTIAATKTLTIADGAKLYAGPTQQVFAGTGTVTFTACGDVYPEWWGVDGTADEVQINLALEAAKNKGIVRLQPEKTYDIAAQIIVPIGRNHIDGSSGRTDLAATCQLLWSSGNDTSIFLVRRQQASQTSIFENLSLRNGNASTGLTGFKAHDSDNNNTPMKLRLYNISVSLCAVGFQIGDDTNDGWSSDFDLFQADNLKTYNCDVGMVLDGDGSDNARFSNLIFEGATCNAASAKLKILNWGTANLMENVFLRGDDLTADTTVVDIDAGDHTLVNFNAEVAGGGKRFMDLGGTVGRGTMTLINCRCAADVMDSSNVSINANYRCGMVMIGCSVPGSVVATYPLVAIDTVFLDSYGFTESGALGKVDHIRTRCRTDYNSSPDTLTSSKLYLNNAQMEAYDTSTILQTRADSTAKFVALPDETATDLFTVSVPDDSRVAIKIMYAVWGPTASNATAYMECGEVFISIVSDADGNMASGSSIVGAADAVDGGGSVAVAFGITETPASDECTITCTQNNEAADVDAFRGSFVATMLHANPATPAITSSLITWEY